VPLPHDPDRFFSFRGLAFLAWELKKTEEEAARITSSILSAISFMHSRGITHRDLKYENILFVDSSPLAEIKLIDFGLSKVFFGGQGELKDGVGT
jgi:serine/threonine protein kinase